MKAGSLDRLRSIAVERTGHSPGRPPARRAQPVLVLGERHLKRLMAEFVRGYHGGRRRTGLEKSTPANREMWTNLTRHGKVISTPKLCGLHHRDVL